MAGSTAIRVPNAVVVMRRRASISRAKVVTGCSRPSPIAATRMARLRWPAAWGTPMIAAAAAAMGTVMLKPGDAGEPVTDALGEQDVGAPADAGE